MRGRVLDLVLVVAAVALGMVLFGSDKPVKKPAKPSGERVAPAFELSRVEGGTFRFEPGEGGAALGIMSLVGCADCTTPERYAQDRQALALAQEAGLDTWHFFIGRPEGAREMASHCATPAAQALVDDRNVCIGEYRANAGTCWVLIDAEGRIVWQGAPRCDEDFRGLWKASAAKSVRLGLDFKACSAACGFRLVSGRAHRFEEKERGSTMKLISDNYFRSTYSVPVRADSIYAYADVDDSGDRSEVDRQLGLTSESGASAIVYRDLLASVKARGGKAGGRDVAADLSEGRRQDPFISFFKLPPGMTHPVVDFAFRLTETGELEATVDFQKRALVTDGMVDHDADGVPEAKLLAEFWIPEGTQPPDLGQDISRQLEDSGRAGPYRDDGPGPEQHRLTEAPNLLFGGGHLDVIERTFVYMPTGVELEYRVQPYKS